MLLSEFAANYDPNDCAVTRFPIGIRADMDQSTEWSMKLGRLLHNRLTGTPYPEDTDATITGYNKWLNDDFIAINTKIVEDKSEEGLRASTELNYHRLNSTVFNNWGFVLAPEIDNGRSPTRAQILKLTQYRLACAGIDYCSLRAQTSEIDTDYAYLQAENDTIRMHHEALMTEFDAGAVLSGVALQHAGMVVVPAPAQFEHSHRKRFNVDWIVVDNKNNRAVGVQAKSHVKAATIEEYDDSVVLLDSDYDIGNGIFHRDTPRRTLERRYVWGGLICAQVVLTSTLAQQAKEMRKLGQLGYDVKGLLHNRQLAQRLVGKQSIKLSQSVKVVDAKITEKL
jgi:hypothetical protein